MKKNITLLATMMLFGSISFAQTLYRTYYDFDKQHVHEEYYANSYGVKNGTYKEYSEYGGVLQEGAYKDDKKIGKWSTKTEKGILSSVETYKDDILNGPYISYYDDNGAKYKEGNFADNKPIGNWYVYVKYRNIDNYIKDYRVDSYHIYMYYDDVPNSALVGCEYVKVLEHIEYFSENNRDDLLGGDWGHVINTYYPSGKKCQEGHFNHGTWIGDYYQYYPNGNLEGFWELDTIQGKELFSKGWPYPGGSKDSIALYKARAIAEQKQQQKSIDEQNRKDESTRHTNDSLQNIKDEYNNIHRKMSYKFDSLHNVFRGLYVGSKQSTVLGVPLVDQQNQPVMKTTYPHGEYLFQKSDTLIKTMWADCKHTSDINSQVSKFNTTTALINKLITLANTDTKDLDKQMKKAETMDDIKKILGLQN